MRHLAMLLSTLTLVGIACSLAGFTDREVVVPGREGSFPHAIHLSEEVGFDCIDCHETAEDEASAGMPDLDVCGLCHFGAFGEDEGSEDEVLAEGEEGELLPGEPEEALPESEGLQDELDPILAQFLLDGDSEPTWTKVMELSIPCNFSHASHSEAGLSCLDCHADVAESDAVLASAHIDMASCMRCHAESEVDDGGCLGCHAGVDESWKPDSHHGSWDKIHGKVWRAHPSGGKGGDPSQDCMLCHSEDSPTQSCEACHLSVAPEDHTPFFKNQGHGFLSVFDRGRCQACHQEDTCLQCHDVMQPRSHVAGFGEPQNRHCLGCHFETQQLQGCGVCHFEGAPAHDLAPTLPPTVPAHATANACMNCHANFKPPRHPITGDGNYCRICHK